MATLSSPRKESPHAHANTCSACTAPVLPADRFCSSCGTPLPTWQPQASLLGATPRRDVPAQSQSPAMGNRMSPAGSPLPPQTFDIELVRALMQESTRLQAEAVQGQPVRKERVNLTATVKTSAMSDTPLRSKSVPRSGRNSSRELSFESSRLSTHSTDGPNHSRGRSLGATSHRTNTSFVSNSSALSEKQRIMHMNRADTSLQSGYFLPEDLRGAQSFSREKRFKQPLGFKHGSFPFYFLDDQVSSEIKSVRSQRRNRSLSRPRSTSSRGRYNTNVTTRWGLSDEGGGLSPGPGAYQPRYAKRA
eukprot:TRINITY_DN34519_c0_g1_i2.p1 TRINITY_DN34519_c0_g1~~TRINITY_DN34519_c0_g1_i2.p1  ORF type:complete len:305 (+),score=64.75 TRINITY_DN34519_c0_g1_i2:428-1342(+)